MKEKISQVINVDTNEFRIMKSGIKYEEIKDLTLSLYDAGLFKSSRVFVELGKPSNPGNFSVIIYEAILNQTEDNELFQYSDQLFLLTVSKDISIPEFKSLIAKEYTNKFMGGKEGVSRGMVRVREK
jgi:hypothetical protein